MSATRNGSSERPTHSACNAWITVLALVLMAVAADTSFGAFVRVGWETRTRATWVTYRPWRLSYGQVSGRAEDIHAASSPGPWCARTATEGSTPWGSWTVEVVTCIRPGALPEGAVKAAATAATTYKEAWP